MIVTHKLEGGGHRAGKSMQAMMRQGQIQSSDFKNCTAGQVVAITRCMHVRPGSGSPHKVGIIIQGGAQGKLPPRLNHKNN